MLKCKFSDQAFYVENRLSDARALNDPTRYLIYSEEDQVTIQAIGSRGIGTMSLRIGDPRLRVTDPGQRVTLELGTVAATPAFPTQSVTATPLPVDLPSGANQSAWLGGIIVAGLVFAGVIATAAMFVWKR